ncbi:MAG: hypothetical protein Fur006_68200 [Coleofasciculaceae cyanobacterium]
MRIQHFQPICSAPLLSRTHVKLRRNMKNRLMGLSDRLLLRKRAIIETVIDQLKNISQIEHSRHRSPINCLVNIVCGLIAYTHQPKKPSIAIDHNLLPAS